MAPTEQDVAIALAQLKRELESPALSDALAHFDSCEICLRGDAH
jgi:hypothetical protein